jgi:hypothetical protein
MSDWVNIPFKILYVKQQEIVEAVIQEIQRKSNGDHSIWGEIEDYDIEIELDYGDGEY